MANQVRKITTVFEAETTKYEKGLKDLEKELGKVEKAQDQVGDTAEKSNEKAAKSTDGFKGSIGGLREGMKELEGTIVAAFSVGALLAFGAKLIDIQKEVEKTTNTVRKMTGLTGKELDKVTAKARTVAKSYDKDFNEVVQATNALAKNMGLEFDKALNLINKGFLKGADVTGEFLEKVREYPVQFKNAGFSAQEFIKIATAEAKGGIYSDKLVDALKEADLSLKELTKTQRDALLPLGEEFVDKLSAGLDAGKISTKEALFQIRDQANDVGLSFREIQTITADVFKGAGEDAGGFVNVMNLLDDALNSQEETLDNVAKATQKLQLEQLKYEGYVQRLSAPGGTLDQLETLAVGALNKMLEPFVGIQMLFESFTEDVEEATEATFNFTEENIAGFDQVAAAMALQEGQKKKNFKAEMERQEALKKVQENYQARLLKEKNLLADLEMEYKAWTSTLKVEIADLYNTQDALRDAQIERTADALNGAEEEVYEPHVEKLIDDYRDMNENKQESDKQYLDYSYQLGQIITQNAIANQRAETQSKIDSLDRERLGEEVYQSEIAQIRKSAALREQRTSTSMALVNAGLAATKTLAQLGYPAALPALALLAVQTGAQISSIRRQKFFKGTKFVKREGAPEGIDTVPAYLTEGEAVIPRDQNRKHHRLVGAIIDGKADMLIKKQYILPELKKLIQDKEQKKSQNFADNIAQSLLVNSKDPNLVFAIERLITSGKKNTDKMIDKLGNSYSNRKNA